MAISIWKYESALLIVARYRAEQGSKNVMGLLFMLWSTYLEAQIGMGPRRLLGEADIM